VSKHVNVCVCLCGYFSLLMERLDVSVGGCVGVVVVVGGCA
jgi:hypothetical protein